MNDDSVTSLLAADDPPEWLREAFADCDRDEVLRAVGHLWKKWQDDILEVAKWDSATRYAVYLRVKPHWKELKDRDLAPMWRNRSPHSKRILAMLRSLEARRARTELWLQGTPISEISS